MAEAFNISVEQKIEILRAAYALFKREVYERRALMMRTTSIGAGVLLVPLFLLPARLIGTGSVRWLVASGVLLFVSILVHQIREQAKRHNQAKQGLVEIERAMRFFDEGVYLQGKPLLPEGWRNLPERDWNGIVSIVCLLGLAIVTIGTLLAV